MYEKVNQQRQKQTQWLSSNKSFNNLNFSANYEVSSGVATYSVNVIFYTSKKTPVTCGNDGFS